MSTIKLTINSRDFLSQFVNKLDWPWLSFIKISKINVKLMLLLFHSLYDVKLIRRLIRLLRFLIELINLLLSLIFLISINTNKITILIIQQMSTIPASSSTISTVSLILSTNPHTNYQSYHSLNLP